jgi:hypothetical protein
VLHEVEGTSGTFPPPAVQHSSVQPPKARLSETRRPVHLVGVLIGAGVVLGLLVGVGLLWMSGAGQRVGARVESATTLLITNQPSSPW